MLAGKAVKEIIRGNPLLNSQSRPFGELLQRALPDNLVFRPLNCAQAGFVERKSVSALEQRPSPRAFPFSVFLLEFPRFELHRTPAKILRSNATKGGENRHAKAGQNLRRNIVKKPGPPPEAAGGFVVQFARLRKQLRLRCAYLF